MRMPTVLESDFMKMNKKIEGLTPYLPDLGEYKVRLDANESCFNLPQSIRAEISALVSDIDFNIYPDPYCEKVVAAYAELKGLNSDTIVAGNGSDELIGIIISSFCQKDDSVVCFSPDFSMYNFYAHLAETQVISLFKDDNFNLDKQIIIDTVVQKKPRIVIFSSPCNPTGQVFCRNDILDIISCSQDCLFVVDQAYADFGGNNVIDMCEKCDNLIVLQTCSKAYGLAAIRLGFAVSNIDIINVIKSVKSPYNVNSVTQVIGEYVLRQKDYLEDCTKKIIQNKKNLEEKLSDLCYNDFRVIKTETNFCFVFCSKAANVHEGLKKKGVLVRLFNNKFLRISTGDKAQNDYFITQLILTLKEENIDV